MPERRIAEHFAIRPDLEDPAGLVKRTGAERCIEERDERAYDEADQRDPDTPLERSGSDSGTAGTGERKRPRRLRCDRRHGLASIRLLAEDPVPARRERRSRVHELPRRRDEVDVLLADRLVDVAQRVPTAARRLEARHERGKAG